MELSMKRRNGVTEYRSKKITTYRDLDVYQMAMDRSMEIFEMTKSFPKEEQYSLTDQIRRSSRSVCANICEAWRKRRYKLSFLSKLSDAETEASETQVWLEFAFKCKYIDTIECNKLDKYYDQIVGKLVRMIFDPDPWLIATISNQEQRRRTTR